MNSDYGHGVEFQRVIPRDFFNTAKVISMACRFLEFYYQGKLPEGIEVTLNDDEGFNAPVISMLQSGELILNNMTVSHNGNDLLLEVPYNTGKTNNYPLLVTYFEEDQYAVFVFGDNGELDSEFIEIFEGEDLRSAMEMDQNMANTLEFWGRCNLLLKNLGRVGLSHLDNFFPRDANMTLSLENDTEDFQYHDDGYGLAISNLEAAINGEPLTFRLVDNVLQYEAGDREGIVFDGSNYSECFMSTLDYYGKKIDLKPDSATF